VDSGKDANGTCSKMGKRMKIVECQQQSVEWIEARCGIPTASEFDCLISPDGKPREGETPKTFLCRKLAEAWNGPLPGFGSFATEQGQILEGEAIPWAEFEFGWKIERVGLVTTDDGRIGCFDRKTDILTHRGFVPVQDVKSTDLIANLDPDSNKIKWSPVLRLIRYHYTGPMHHYGDAVVNLVVTPNHRLWGTIVKWVGGRRRTERTGFIESQDLGGSGEFVQVPEIWHQEQVDPKEYEVQELTPVKNHPKGPLGFRVPFIDWARFVGLWIAEGWTEKNRQGTNLGKVGIAQTAAGKLDAAKEIIKAIPVRWCQKKNGWTTERRALAEALVLSCGSGTFGKRVPSYIRFGSRKAIRAFLGGFMIGDGWTGRNGQRSLFTSNKALADDLCELVIRAGWWPSLHIRSPRRWNIRGRTGWSKIQYHINIRKTGKAYHVISKDPNRALGFNVIQHDDDVFCVTTHTGIVLVRRGGRFTWVGNCSPDGLIGDYSGVEIKCPAAETHVKYLLKNEVPKEHISQIQGAMFVTGRKEWQFISYRRHFPALVITVPRDEIFQEKLAEALEIFLGKFDRAMARLIELNGGPPPPRVKMAFADDIAAGRSRESYEDIGVTP